MSNLADCLEEMVAEAVKKALKKQQAEYDEWIEKLETRVEELSAQLNRNIVFAHSRIEKLEERLDSLAEKHNKVADAQTSLEAIYLEMEQEKDLKTRVEDLEKEMNGSHNRLDHLQKWEAKEKDILSSVWTHIYAVEGKVRKLEEEEEFTFKRVRK